MEIINTFAVWREPVTYSLMRPEYRRNLCFSRQIPYASNFLEATEA